MSEPDPVEVFDLASLEAFMSKLVAAGFEPQPGTGRRCWIGPVHPAFSALTDVTVMRIVIRDGWPVVFPLLFVDGLHTNHLTAEGYVCLWHEGDGSRAWITLPGLFKRIDEWCHDAEHGWDPHGLARDAQLNFTKKHPAVATFDLDALDLGAPGSWGSFHGELRHPLHVELKRGRRPDSRLLDGLWFRMSAVQVPPRNLDEIRTLLPRAQSRALDRGLNRRRAADALAPSGSIDLALLCWNRDDRRHVLVLTASGAGSDVAFAALHPGPHDEKSLLIRAGPDAVSLRNVSVAVFGVGALGGHVALTLAESGVGRLLLIDGDQILPGNVVRHVAGHQTTGVPKVHAVGAAIADHAPWANVRVLIGNPMTPSKLATVIAEVDFVVDTTGGGAATQAIAATASAAGKPLISGALYRGGAIARVRRQGAPGDVEIHVREFAPEYPVIPPGADEDEFTEPAIGCSAPINNAPPSSVTACAALISQAAVDAITGRCDLPDEIIDVYRALPHEAPFDRLGRLQVP